MVTELGNVRQRRSTPSDNWQQNTNYSQNYSESSLKDELQKYFDNRKEKGDDQITFVKRSKISPFSGQMKRIMLAFESHLQDEVRFALNFLLMYSCSNTSLIVLEDYSNIFEGMLRYLKAIMANCPGILDHKGTEELALSGVHTFSNSYNKEISELVKGSTSTSPIEEKKEDIRMQISHRYEEISGKEALE